ncbi:Na(+)/H(+) antiporter subunit B [Thermobrachium celere]|uniref:Na(+)/H(+) antiporter subunit B n=1 Tax=Thermobrachium celere TaxID=53422 RepID=UPI0019414294|nr:hydrogenase subunit MbhD domain-containing protein [Thermobrachium celere]GFR34687.1 sodium:proton antiporter [Thermobrachium celere]
MINLAIFIAVVMFLGAVWTVLTEDVFKAIVIFGIVSLMSSVMFLLMQAPDVAITEAAIGSGITTALFIFTYKKMEERKDER